VVQITPHPATLKRFIKRPIGGSYKSTIDRLEHITANRANTALLDYI
jgi:hypothetical protein